MEDQEQVRESGSWPAWSGSRRYTLAGILPGRPNRGHRRKHRLPGVGQGKISERFCFVEHSGRITFLGPVYLEQSVTDAGSVFLWHTESKELAYTGHGSACVPYDPHDCWQYVYRKGHFEWSQGLGPASWERHACLSITMRGTGRVIPGKPEC